jgi:hypothetical protein
MLLKLRRRGLSVMPLLQFERPKAAVISDDPKTIFHIEAG